MRALVIACLCLLAGPAAADGFGAAMDRGVERSAFGGYDEALDAFRTAADLAERAGEDDQLADAAMHVALAAAALRRFEEAKIWFARAEPLARAAADPTLYPRYAGYLAVATANRGEREAAYDLALEATAMRRRLLETARGREQVVRTLLDLAQSLFVEAVLGYQLGRLDAAEEAAELARRIVTETAQAPDWWIAHIDEVLAYIEAEQGDVGSAQDRLRRARATKRASFGDTRPAALSFLASARVLALRSGDAEEALRDARGARRILDIEDQRVSVGRVTGFLAAALAEDDDDPALAAEMFEAMQLADTGAATAAADQMALRLAGGDAGVAEIVRAAQTAARSRDALRLQVGRLAMRGAPGLDAAKARLRAAQAEAERAEARLRERAPQIVSLTRPQPASAQAVAARLAPDEAFLAILYDDDAAYAVVLRADGAPEGRALAADGRTIRDSVALLRTAFAVEDGGVRPFDMEASHALYRLLIAPLGEALAGAARVYVWSHGPLLGLPLGMLVTSPPPDGEAYAQADWLIDRHAFVTTPSIAAFAARDPSAERRRRARPLLAFTDPVLTGRGAGSGDCRPDAPADPAALRALAPLPGTREETAAVRAVLGGGDVLAGGAFTEAALRRSDLTSADVLYFATHGLVPGELSCGNEPGLVATPPQSRPGSRSADGLIAASEIAGFTIDAELVVLSACNTGAGGEGGEALSGLASAFLFAGARALVVTHWVVDSQTTARLMADAFERSDGDLQRLPGLVAAQRAAIRSPQSAHPFFWAAFDFVSL